MNTLIVYDTSGRVWVQITGDYLVPVGLPYLEVVIPEGKLVAGVDITVTPHVPIYEDAPVPETKVLEDRVAFLESAFNEMVLGV